MANTPNITVIVRNREKILYNGQPFAVTSINEKGIFDILPQHENFISTIKDKIVIHQTPKENQEIQIQNGIVRVYKDKVYIYINFES